MSTPIYTDVLVVGAGVTGLTSAALLARQGIPAVTISKYPSTANTPRAHITNQRTLEVLRDLGIEDRVYQDGLPMTVVPNTTWVTSLAGRELARRRSWGTHVDRQADYQASSPCSMVNIGQHLLEPIIHRRAVELGADIRFLNELVEIAQDDSGVTATVRYRPTGDVHQIRAKYVVGADGGRSLIADQLNFRFEGETNLGYALNAWFEADLSKFVAHRPGVLYWTSYPGRDDLFGSGTFLAVRPWNEWVIQFSYDPASENLDTSEELILPRIRLAIGDDTVPVEIKAMTKWEVNHVVAQDYRVGRVFLAGDAAHRHPPANGLGSNTSIQDAYNLTWKLALVLRGKADPSLLDTYSSERQPVGRRIIDRAIESVGLAGDILRAMGIERGQDEQQGWAALDRLFLPTTDGEFRRQELDRQLERFDYGVNCHGVEMGQRYETGALVDDGTPWPPYRQDPQLFYQPTTHPGAYLPHVWLEHRGALVSSLDVVPEDSWALLTGVDGESWRGAAKQVADELGVELVSCAIGRGLDYADVYGDWTATREITDRGCLLVRPDRHIAWRKVDTSSEPVTELRDALRRILHPST
ncbi:FAD-dependent monooxygenase [Mycobacterium sp. 1245852.3]|uniref:FAD-dependent oxidoreductase n=1 Tax=Mycobacterium sp. 1245852.3 TaxID=1856860 RepID=UPI0007FDCF07|nr:FAD-dependent monooxygenase [Mycobacterium sp. 1245852.3]OBJ83290.1 2,4-dichlorophenol 6-monooxygenase [Mycobacterium sp. 1245852.3]